MNWFVVEKACPGVCAKYGTMSDTHDYLRRMWALMEVQALMIIYFNCINNTSELLRSSYVSTYTKEMSKF